MSGHTATQLSDAVRDLVSHREAWRSAIEIAIEQASDSRDDMDEKGYLKHELAAFDRTFSVLDEQSSSIVTACNSHAELVKALEEIRDGLADTGSTPGQRMTFITKMDAHLIAYRALATLTARKVG